MGTTFPNFFVVGAMRSGTTSLARALGAHPDVFLAPVKEIHFFDRNYHRGLDWYRSHFADVTTEQAVGEATQTYLYDPDALERMVAVAPEARLVAILRDPVDRAYSHYWHERARGWEPLEFEDAIAAEPDRLAAGGEARYRYSYLDRGRYLAQLQRLCQVFPREALVVVQFEDFRDDPKEVYTSVCRHLQVDDGMIPAILGERINPYVTFRSRWVRTFSRQLPARLREVAERLNVREATYPPMAPATRERLTAAFAHEVATLADWLGRDLSIWPTAR